MGMSRMLGDLQRRRCTRLTPRAVRLTAVVAMPAMAAALVACSVPASASAMTAARPMTSAQQALNQAGSGWALAMYASGRDTYHTRVTLYLTSPAGAAYAVRAWPHGTTWLLQAWSPDRARAIFATEPANGSGPTVVYQLTLASGATTTFALPQFSRVIGYTLPTGRSVLVADRSGIYIYSLTGARLARLSSWSGAAGFSSGGGVMSRTGQQIVVPTGYGLALVSPAGVMLRKLPVPHTKGACLPERWSSAGVVIAACMPSQSSSGPQVFRVPVNGAAPVAVTQVGSVANGDFGAVDAWIIGGSTYVQAEQPCGAGFIGRLGAGGSVVPVAIPGNPESTVIDSVAGHRLLLTETGCDNRNRLAVLTLPGGSARTILPYGRGTGAFEVVPYNRDGFQP